MISLGEESDAASADKNSNFPLRVIHEESSVGDFSDSGLPLSSSNACGVSREMDFPRQIWSTRPYSAIGFICKAFLCLFWASAILLGLLNLVPPVWDGMIYLISNDLNVNLGPAAFPQWNKHSFDPVKCGSSNDYWRRAPLRSAIDAGCLSIKADIWPSNQDVLVGHSPYSLHQDASLHSLYLTPLFELLQERNKRPSQPGPSQGNNSSLAGAFTKEPSQSLVLLLDFKANGDKLWPLVVDQLRPLRKAGYLTNFNGTNINERPVTIVATGNVPLHSIIANQTYRDIFYDVPLEALPQTQLSLEAEPTSPPHRDAESSANPEHEPGGIEDNGIQATTSIPEEYNITNSYYASVDFFTAIGTPSCDGFSQYQLALIRSHIKTANRRGLRVRYWRVPSWPRGLWKYIWYVLIREGAHLINVDNMGEAAQQNCRERCSWFC